MFVLSRRENESVLIDDDIVVTVERIAAEFVELAVTAPVGLVRRLSNRFQAIPSDQRCLSVDAGQSLHLGDAVRIVVIAVEDERTRLGVDYPAGASIRRSE